MANHLLMWWVRPHAMSLTAVQPILACTQFALLFDTERRLTLTDMRERAHFYRCFPMTLGYNFFFLNIPCLRSLILLFRVNLRWRRTWSTGAMTLTRTEVLGANPVPLPLCSPQISHWLVWAVTWIAAVTGRWITAEPCHDLLKTEFNQSNIQRFGSYVRDNTDLLSYKIEPIHKV